MKWQCQCSRDSNAESDRGHEPRARGGSARNRATAALVSVTTCRIEMFPHAKYGLKREPKSRAVTGLDMEREYRSPRSVRNDLRQRSPALSPGF